MILWWSNLTFWLDTAVFRSGEWVTLRPTEATVFVMLFFTAYVTSVQIETTHEYGHLDHRDREVTSHCKHNNWQSHFASHLKGVPRGCCVFLACLNKGGWSTRHLESWKHVYTKRNHINNYCGSVHHWHGCVMRVWTLCSPHERKHCVQHFLDCACVVVFLCPTENKVMRSFSLSIKYLLAPWNSLQTRLASKWQKHQILIVKCCRARRTYWWKPLSRKKEGRRMDVLSQLSFYSLYEVGSAQSCQNVKMKIALLSLKKNIEMCKSLFLLKTILMWTKLKKASHDKDIKTTIRLKKKNMRKEQREKRRDMIQIHLLLIKDIMKIKINNNMSACLYFRLWKKALHIHWWGGNCQIYFWHRPSEQETQSQWVI